MPRSVAALSAAALLALPAQAAGDDHPIDKVVTMLKGLSTKVDEEGKEEALTYEKFEYWCTNSKKTLTKATLEAKETLEELATEISSQGENIGVLTDAIAKLEEELSKLDQAGTRAKKERDEGAALYKKERETLTGTVTALDGAIELMEGAKSSTATLLLSQQRVKAMIALLGTSISPAQRSLLEEFSQDTPDDWATRGNEAAGSYSEHVKKYKFKSGNVIELMKELKAQFEKDKVDLDEAETNAVNAYELAKAAREDTVNAAKKSKTEKTEEKTASEGDLADAKKTQGETQDDLAADSDTLKTTDTNCRVKASEWEERSATRKNEKEAIKAAIEILAKVSGVRTDAPSNPVPPPAPMEAAPAFLQLGNPKTQKAVELLRKEARIMHSKALERLAAQVATMREEGPFDQAINMIEKMIFHLMNEQTEEDNHKLWCDKEVSKTNASIVNKVEKLDDLKTKIEEATARVAMLTEEIKEADTMVNDIVAHVEEATDIRKIGKKENALAVKDAQDAQTALANAIAVLKDHYKESGEIQKESWEFLQQERAPVTLPETPSTWDSGYTGVSDPDAQPGGIVTVLETTSADFAKMQSETEAQEEADQNAYNEDIQKCAIEKARRTKEAEMKEQEKRRLLEKLEGVKKTHKGVSTEHEATVQYMTDLQHACVDGDSTYEERKAARSDEITALKGAQELLEDAFKNITKSKPDFLQIRRH